MATTAELIEELSALSQVQLVVDSAVAYKRELGGLDDLLRSLRHRFEPAEWAAVQRFLGPLRVQGAAIEVLGHRLQERQSMARDQLTGSAERRIVTL